MAGAGAGATGVVQVSSMGKPATARSAGVAGPTEPYDCRADRGHRTGGREVSRGAALEDPSRSGCADRAGLRADHWPSGAISVWETDCELSRTGATGKVQRKSETAGSHHQTREFDGALFAGGGGAGHRAQSSRVAQKVRSPHDAARVQDRQGSDGTETGRRYLLDVAQGMELRAVKKFGSHAGQLGTGDGVQ